jgi:hypothetical protein
MVPPEGKDVAVYDVTAKADLQALLLPAAAHDSNIDAASLQRQQQPVSLTVAVILAQVLQLNDRADRLFRQNARVL